MRIHEIIAESAHTHPDYDARMDNLKTGKRQQKPLYKEPENKASSMKQNANGSFTLGESKRKKG